MTEQEKILQLKMKALAKVLAEVSGQDPYAVSNKGNIVPTHIRKIKGPPPPTLKMVGIERIKNRTILEWDHILGTYGMGGPGFFGLKLARTRAFPKEWLVLTLWNASHWLLLDGRWLQAHPVQYHLQRPWHSAFGGEENWDEASPLLVGSLINQASIEDAYSLIELKKDGQCHLLELPKDTSKLPFRAGIGQPRTWQPEESHWNAWVISPSPFLWC